MKINKIYAYDLRNDAHFQFYTEFRNLVQKEGAVKQKIATQFEEWLPLYDNEDTALKKIQKSAITAQIQDADRARDEIYLGMVETSNAALKHFGEEVRGAAARLKILFDTYGEVTRKPLNEQTSAVYNILQELKGKYAPDTALVGISSWVSELEARNNAFADLMRERFDETASRTDIVLKEARVEVDNAYFAIRERVNALVVVEGLSVYENFIRTLNAVIAKYALLTKPRGGRGTMKFTFNLNQKEFSMKKIVPSLLFAMAILFFTGCTTRIGQLTTVSTKNMEWNRAGEYVRSNKTVVGKDISHIIVFIPTKFQVTIDDAIKDALDQIPGAVALVDATLRYQYIFVFLYSRMGYIIEGTVLIDPKLAGTDVSSDYQFYYDEDGKMITLATNIYSPSNKE